jgi:hypothetical protein
MGPAFAVHQTQQANRPSFLILNSFLFSQWLVLVVAPLVVGMHAHISAASLKSNVLMFAL